QVRGLIDGGVDLLLVETIFDTLNAKAALVAIDEVFESRIPNPESRVPNPESRVPSPESRVPNPESRIPSPESRIPSPESRVPVMISVTVTDKSGRTLSGQTIDAFWTSVSHAKPFSVGINCALGARDMRPYLAELAEIADCWVTCYPNAGLPNAFGQYDEQPRETSELLREFASSGFVNIIGGCCGTTPEPIPAIATA